MALVADPRRWQLLTELSRSDLRVGELTERLGRPQSVVSYHLAELRSAGIVTARRSSADGRDVYYRADLERCRHLLAEARGLLHPALVAPPRGPTRRGRVLFLCTGNSARSQMAAALLVERSGGMIEAWSAGSEPKPLHPMAVRVMAERGIDIAGRESTHLRRFVCRRFDRVVTLCDKVREVCPEFTGAAAAVHWSIPDPTAETAVDAAHPVFVRVADELESRIAPLITELSAEPDPRRSHGR
ncbi:MAG: metalloregulator ArsR/SmtB family transcription factor [Acidimicrobiia bacterium]|nr:metalloregulator ArsR/SmtB family transcription factor [Acidimicrobiia bacterium]